MPTILHVVHSVEPGGTEQMVCRLADALNGHDARHMVCSLRAARPFDGEFAHNTDVLALNAGPRDRFLFVKLARLIRTHQVDIVHARNWGTWSDALLASQLSGRCRVLLGFHGMQSAAAFTTRQRRRAKWLRMVQHDATTVSWAAADQLANQLAFDRARIHVIPNGVDTLRFRPPSATDRLNMQSQLGIAPDEFVVGCVANFFSEVKGHRELVEAFVRFNRINSRGRLVLVGYGPLLNQIKGQVQRAGIADRVIFAGRCGDVRSVLAATDVYVCSSLSEGMSNAVLEAMASGIPCVVTNVSDHRRMFAGIDADYVTPVGDAQAIADRLATLAKDPQRRMHLAQRARDLVKREYRFTDMLSAYRRLYASLYAGTLAAPDHVHGDVSWMGAAAE